MLKLTPSSGFNQSFCRSEAKALSTAGHDKGTPHEIKVGETPVANLRVPG